MGRGTKYKINEDYLSYNTNSTSNSTSNDTSNGTSRRTRKSIDTLRIEILEACSNYVSLEEIAQKVGKSISHLKGQIIPQMLQENLLERQFPNAPRHPHQKYRTVKK